MLDPKAALIAAAIALYAAPALAQDDGAYADPDRSGHEAYGEREASAERQGYGAPSRAITRVSYADGYLSWPGKDVGDDVDGPRFGPGEGGGCPPVGPGERVIHCQYIPYARQSDAAEDGSGPGVFYAEGGVGPDYFPEGGGRGGGTTIIEGGAGGSSSASAYASASASASTSIVINAQSQQPPHHPKGGGGSWGGGSMGGGSMGGGSWGQGSMGGGSSGSWGQGSMSGGGGSWPGGGMASNNRYGSWPSGGATGSSSGGGVGGQHGGSHTGARHGKT